MSNYSNGLVMQETSDKQPGAALDFLGELRRTHTCGQLRASDSGKSVLLMGWVSHLEYRLGGFELDLEPNRIEVS